MAKKIANQGNAKGVDHGHPGNTKHTHVVHKPIGYKVGGNVLDRRVGSVPTTKKRD